VLIREIVDGTKVDGLPPAYFVQKAEFALFKRPVFFDAASNQFR
jgi:hypothetical protein